MRLGIFTFTFAVVLAGSAMAMHPDYQSGFRQACAAEISDYVTTFYAEQAERNYVPPERERQSIINGDSIQLTSPIDINHLLPYLDEQSRTAGTTTLRAVARYEACAYRYLLRAVPENEARYARQQEAELQLAQQQQESHARKVQEQQEAELAAMRNLQAQAADQASNNVVDAGDDNSAGDNTDKGSPADSGNRLALNATHPAEKKKIIGEPAHGCLSLLDQPGTYGGFHNSCDFKVHFAWCAYNPKKDTDAQYFDCANWKSGTDGLAGVAPKGDTGALVKRAEYIFWFACKTPSAPKNIEYHPGSGLWGSCG